MKKLYKYFEIEFHVNVVTVIRVQLKKSVFSFVSRIESSLNQLVSTPNIQQKIYLFVLKKIDFLQLKIYHTIWKIPYIFINSNSNPLKTYVYDYNIDIEMTNLTFKTIIFQMLRSFGCTIFLVAELVKLYDFLVLKDHQHLVTTGGFIYYPWSN